MVERARVVEQPEQQRPDVRARPVLVPAEAGHDAIGGPLVLDLEHRPLARLVRRIEPLRDDAIEPGALEPFEPVGRGRPIARRGRQVDRRLGAAEDRLEAGPPLALRDVAQVLVAERQQVPGRRSSRATRSASISTRDAAGWMRSSSDSNWSAPSRAMTTSPSRTQRSGSAALSGAASSGK